MFLRKPFGAQALCAAVEIGYDYARYRMQIGVFYGSCYIEAIGYGALRRGVGMCGCGLHGSGH